MKAKIYIEKVLSFHVFSYLLGVLLGLSMAAPPGPINAIMANESLRSKLHGSSVGFGAMTADFIFFLITFEVRKFIPENLLVVFYFIGGGLMIFLSYATLKAKVSNRSKKGNYFTGLIMGITNPYQISWWITVGLFMINEFGISIILPFFGGIIIWIFAFTTFINRLGNKYAKYVKIFSFIILLAFGLYMIYEGVISLL
ncbi:Lysine exporter protein (LYSE/YGGA) [Acidianus hospitalis W1]|uniref:Lysine exporter protein (LYSE/YGGA) n=2 Tax=Acidianus TaxID=12914 RepID=F4B967_ACIHW|nr:Lysine exporter protein (LYSE/YGGA) [Acidianus hospitalis W1]